MANVKGLHCEEYNTNMLIKTVLRNYHLGRWKGRDDL